MTTVARRTFRSTPHRDALQTWNAIIDLLAHGGSAGARDELLSVAGIASSVIADQAPRTAPIVVTCDGPRTRIYCVYDDDALDDSEADENPLGFDPLKGDWHISLPCLAADLGWVQAALKKHGTRITARDLADDVPAKNALDNSNEALVLDEREFLKS